MAAPSAGESTWPSCSGVSCGRGHEARLFASTAEPIDDLPFEADAGCFGTMSPLRRVSQVFNPDAARRLRREIADFRPDVVHVRMFLTQLSPLILPLLRGVPALLHVVTYDVICPIDTKTLPDGSPCRFRPGVACHRAGCMPWVGVARAGVQHGMTRRWLPAFDRIVANSRWVRDRLRADGLRCESFVWNGVPEQPPRPPLTGPPTFASAGRLVAKKGVDVLIRAMPEILRRVPEATLKVVGDGPELAPLKRLAEDSGVAKRVSFPGHLSHAELEELLASTWVQAVPSLWEEPFGIASAEAMFRGTAVVASASGGLAEQVVDGETGLLCPPGDVVAWTEALARVLGDRGLAERYGAAGRERAQSLFTVDRFMDGFLKVYGEIIAGAAARR